MANFPSANARSMDAVLRDRVRKAVNRLVHAEVAASWKGGGHPDDIPAIEKELKVARKKYNDLLNSITFS